MTHTFRVSGDLGDIIYALPVIKQCGGGKLYWRYEPGITPKMGKAQWAALEPLLRAQPYITHAGPHDGAPITHDLVHFRAKYMPRRTLAMTQARYLGLGELDTVSPWLTRPDEATHGRPVFARSERYNNPDWGLVWPEAAQKYPNALFVGTQKEHALLQKLTGPLEYCPTADFADLAAIIGGASIFIGNQSSPYAVAEGLKVATIQETYPRQADCLYPRKNARFIGRYAEWAAFTQGPRKGDERLMLALQCHPGDVAQAAALVALICDIEPTKREDVDFCLAVRRDVDPVSIGNIKARLLEKFGKVLIVRGKRSGVGWPAGANDLWAETMMRLSMARKEGKHNCGGILTFEPDCVPLRADWVNIIKAAWVAAMGAGKDATGHFDTDPDHMNGNAVFKCGLLNQHPALNGAGAEGWDTYHAPLLVSIGADTDAIAQYYQLRDYDRGYLTGYRKNGQIPGLFHGVKGPQGARYVRQMLESGELAARARG